MESEKIMLEKKLEEKLMLNYYYSAMKKATQLIDIYGSSEISRIKEICERCKTSVAELVLEKFCYC